MIARGLLPLALLGSLLGASVSCNKGVNGGSPAPVTGSPVATEAARKPPRRQTLSAEARMREHFAEVDTMQRGLVAGELEVTKRAAEFMASDEWSPRLKPEWQPYVESMRSAASAVAKSGDIQAGANALAVLANTCAQCHAALVFPKGGQINVPSEPAVTEMAKHARASRLMWWGLSTPSEEAWMNGAEQLALANLGSDVPELQALQQRVTELANASRSSAVSERGALYAKTIATCAACHREVGLQLDVASVKR